MRILIADDDASCRSVLTLLLKKAGHEVVAAGDGALAIAALKAPDAPLVAILDWMMPNLSGVEVCAQLRASDLKQRPYVIMLSALTSKADIVAGLDAGADDYLPKPINHSELMARLRVAERAIRHQRELQGQIEELEAMVKRYQLLGEIVARQGGEGSSSSPGRTTTTTGSSKEPAFRSQLPAVTAASSKAFEELSHDEVEAIVTQMLSELGLNDPEERVTLDLVDARQTAPYTAWAGLILVKNQIWVDVLLQATRAQVARISEKLLNRPGQDKELPYVLAETQTILSAAFKAAIQARGGEVMAPLLSRVTEAEIPPDASPLATEYRSHIFTVAHSPLRLTLIATPCSTQNKHPDQLRPLDTLAKGVFMPESPGVLLLKEGTTLNARHIERLANMANAYQQKISVPVFAPSALAEYFCR